MLHGNSAERTLPAAAAAIPRACLMPCCCSRRSIQPFQAPDADALAAWGLASSLLGGRQPCWGGCSRSG